VDRAPAEAVAFYQRWWQFERWLREVAYVELRAKFGPAWTEKLAGNAPARRDGDRANSYMASADADDLLAYADVSQLFALVEAHCDLFGPFLPPTRRWQGMTDMLGDLRNRNAHCRRPHDDDLSRLEQTLRDLEAGAREFYRSYASTQSVEADSTDPLAKAWVAGEHDTAQRLLRHAEQNYDTRFALRYSVRPWAAIAEGALSGCEGVLWHADWIVTGPELRPVRLWNEIANVRSVERPLIHLILDSSHVSATFSALEEPTVVADAIGRIFDAILVTSDPYRTVDIENLEASRAQWRRGTERLPTRVQIDTPLTLTDFFDEFDFSIFGA
jgi:hypothetical protein